MVILVISTGCTVSSYFESVLSIKVVLVSLFSITLTLSYHFRSCGKIDISESILYPLL